MPVDEEEMLEFDVDGRRDHPDEPPIKFKLNVVNADGETEPFVFRAIREPGLGGAMAFNGITYVDTGTGRRRPDGTGLMRFFYRILEEGEYERLAEIIDRKDLKIHGPDLAKVFNALSEMYDMDAFGGSPRPTPPSNGSAGSPSSTGQPSRAKPRSGAKS